MMRRTISLALILALAAVLVGADPQTLLSAPGSGDVDPTGLDQGSRLTSVPERGIPIVTRGDFAFRGASSARWIEMFYFRLLFRSLGL